MKLSMNKGQSLIEVLAALGIAVIIAAGVAISVLISLSNSQSVNALNAASEYSQQAMEIMKQIKDTDYANYSNFTNNYCFGADQSTLTNTASAPTPGLNGPPSIGGCIQNIGTFIREVDIEKNSCDCGSNLGLATPVQVDKVTITVAWADGKCPATGEVPIGVSSGTTCKSGLQNRINSKYCHTAVHTSCFTRLYDVGKFYNTPIPTPTP